MNPEEEQQRRQASRDEGIKKGKKESGKDLWQERRRETASKKGKQRRKGIQLGMRLEIQEGMMSIQEEKK